MKDPQRLLEDGAALSVRERRVLEAGQRLAPPSSAKRSVRLALSASLGGGVLASGTVASGALAGLSFGKGLILGLVVGGGVSAGVMALRPESNPASVEQRAPAPIASNHAVTVQAPISDHVLQAPEIPAEAVSLPASPGPKPIEANGDLPSGALAPAPSVARLPDLETQPVAGAAVAESRRVAEARGLLRRGDARGALAILDRTAVDFPNGVLGQEREALAIEALFETGARTAARTRAAAFLKRHPESPHAVAVRRVLGE